MRKQEIEILLSKEEEEELKKKKKNKILIEQIILITVILVSVINIILYYADIDSNNSKNGELFEEIAENKDKDNNDKKIKIDFEKLLKINNNTKGWIIFNNNKINYPIVQHTDNNYYLNRAFDKQFNKAGAIYMDYRNDNFDSTNTILYGHAMTDQSMFGSLSDIYNANFFSNKDNNIIKIINVKNDIMLYKIFSYYIIEAEEYYITPSFETLDDYKQFIDIIKSRSKEQFEVNVDKNDKILTLSTCYGVGNTNKRIVVHAKYIGNR